MMIEKKGAINLKRFQVDDKAFILSWLFPKFHENSCKKATWFL